MGATNRALDQQAANRTRVLDAVRKLTDDNAGIPPSFAEVARRCRMSPDRVAEHARTLMESGEWPRKPARKLKNGLGLKRKWDAAGALVRATYPGRYGNHE
jgi:hypothetical protein